MTKTLPKNKGFLLSELLIASALFVGISAAIGTLIFDVQSFLLWSKLRIKALEIADQQLEAASVLLEDDFEAKPQTDYSEEEFSVITNIKIIDNFTKEIEVVVEYSYKKRIISYTLSTKVTNVEESEGQDSCRPSQDHSLWLDPIISSFDLSELDFSIEPTDIDIVGKYVYVTSNSGIASQPDLFIFSIEHFPVVTLIGKLDTGPGLSAIHVVGKFVYAANTSVTNQLQIIDIEERSHPILITSYKLPGNYGTSTPIGTSLFYKAGKIFLGTDKSAIEELHYLDISTSSSITHLSSIEIDHGINDILAFKDKVYVASPHRDEMKAYTISSSGFIPFSSFNDPGSIGTGKRLSLFNDLLFLGKTKTFDDREVFALSATSTIPTVYASHSLPASMQGLKAYGNLLFTLIHSSADGFIIFEKKPSSFERLNITSIRFESSPLNFDCDQSVFGIILENSSIISFITHS